MSRPTRVTSEQAEIVACCYHELASDDDWREQVRDIGDVDADDIDITSDAFERYDGSAWAEAFGREAMIIEGFPAIRWERVQAGKGGRRVSLAVVDFGEFRAIYQV